jgi:glutamine synthetase
VLLHEKPFKGINGSGKHVNWSMNYLRKNGSLKNVFTADEKDTPKDLQIFKLFILIQLIAAFKHHKLYMAATSTPGN